LNLQSKRNRRVRCNDLFIRATPHATENKIRAMHLIPLAFSGDTDFTEFHGLNQR